jgi:hypothetical protein
MCADNHRAEVDYIHAFARLVLNSNENVSNLNAATQLRAAAGSDSLDSDATIAARRQRKANPALRRIARHTHARAV